MKEKLIKELLTDLLTTTENHFGDPTDITYSFAADIIDMGWTKQIWHKVSENDLPTRQGQRVWLCTTSKDYFMANYYDDTPLGGQQFFEIANAGRITLSNVIAWMELPKYEEQNV